MCIDDQEKLNELQNKPIEDLSPEEREALTRMLKEIEEETRKEPKKEL